jgi:hypothetical protein
MNVPVEVNQLAQAALNVIAFVIAVAASAGIVGKIVVWVKGRFDEFKAAQPDNIRSLIDWAVMLAAEFAEKLELSDQLEQYARSKKDLALEYAHNLLLQVGFDIDMKALDAALESVLFNNPDKFPSSKG